MTICNESIQNIKNQIINKFNPVDIILFGSLAKGLSRKGSDIDICVIKETDNKRKLIQDILFEVDEDVDLDVVVYTPSQWERYKNDKMMFAHVINRTGVSIVG
jgi:predicted nucleotidyltransferase